MYLPLTDWKCIAAQLSLKGGACTHGFDGYLGLVTLVGVAH